jgi:dihydrofolate reductase
MGKLVVSEFMSVDGVVEDPGGSGGTAQGGWSFRHPAPGSLPYKFDELMAGDVMLLGRVTYEDFAVAWPARENTEFGARMNSIPKVVVSSTLTDPRWRNTTVLRGDVPGQVAKLKEQYDGDILVFGSVALVDTLRGHGLVDEYRLMIHPVLLGEGKRLFRDGSAAADLELIDSRTVGPDVILLTYRPARTPATAGVSPFTAS